MNTSFRELALQATSARVGLRRSGVSLSTEAVLSFRWDHAEARDAVWKEMVWPKDLVSFPNTFELESLAKDKSEYLLRPDLGRRLNSASESKLREVRAADSAIDISISLVDGLSAVALEKNGYHFLNELFLRFEKSEYNFGPLTLVNRGRVAIGDSIGELLQAKIQIVIIGERPGLSSADSLGVYLTYNPKLGTTDERRNCISNIRPEGFPFKQAADKVFYLVKEAFNRQQTGVWLKDRMNTDLIENSNQTQINDNPKQEM